MPQTIALTCEVLAVLTSAAYGVLAARRAGFDFVGIYTLAMLIAFGGGTFRDLFLDRHPLFWIANPAYPVLVFGLAVLSLALPRLRLPGWLEAFDALALGLYTAAGVEAALAAGTSWFVASLFGVIAGCFGGVVADMMVGLVPRLFRGGNPIYATCSMIGGWTLLLATAAGLPSWGPVALCVATVIIVRLLAIRYRWHLPEVRDRPPKFRQLLFEDQLAAGDEFAREQSGQP